MHGVCKELSEGCTLTDFSFSGDIIYYQMTDVEKKEFSFEEKLDELEKIVNKLETGQVPLDDAIEEFKRAMDLVKECDEKLNSAQEAIAKIVNDNNELSDFNIE